MTESVTCRKCGYASELTSRYCKKCGNPLFIVLNSHNLKNEKFIDVFNSVYNLLCDKTNLEKQKYSSPLTDKVIWQRIKSIYKNHAINASLTRVGLGLNPFVFDFNPLYQRSASNILSGYSLRLTEELYTDKKSNSLEATEIESIIRKYMVEGKESLGEQFLYREEDIEDPCVKRIVFSEAIMMYQKYAEFFLLDKDEIEDRLNEIISQAIELTMELQESVLTKFYNSHEVAKKLITTKKEGYADEVIGDVSFGYGLRLSEQLMPNE